VLLELFESEIHFAAPEWMQQAVEDCTDDLMIHLEQLI
jgi:hypothetical protein